VIFEDVSLVNRYGMLIQKEDKISENTSIKKQSVVSHVRGKEV
jgi:hypothetical protein